MAQGAHSFGGYRENFNLVWDEGGASMWELFAEADAAWDFAMANGDTAQEAHDATVAAFNAAIASVPGTWTAAVLTQDRDDLTLSGDPAATISPHHWVRICWPISLTLEKALVKAGELHKVLPVR